MVPSVILALDVKDKTKARATLEAVGEKLEWVKIGLQTYLRDGPEFVREVADSGKNVFLDLKLYDIPNTMVKSLESLVDLPVGMLTLHASAGPSRYSFLYWRKFIRRKTSQSPCLSRNRVWHRWYCMFSPGTG